jgi:hypothetical protein
MASRYSRRMSKHRSARKEASKKTAAGSTRASAGDGRITLDQRQRRVTVDRSAESTASAFEAHKTLLPQLGKLLDKLSANEWDALSAAASRPHKKPERASVVFSVASGLPIEAVPVSLSGEVDGDPIGILLVRRKSLEGAVKKAPHERYVKFEAWRQHTPATEHTSRRVDNVLNEIADNVGLWIAAMITLPLSPSCLSIDDCVRVLQLMPPKQLDRWLWVPSVTQSVQRIRLHGSPQQRKTAQKILKAGMSKPGPVPKELSDLEDIKIARESAAVEVPLAGYLDENQGFLMEYSARDQFREALNALGCTDAEISQAAVGALTARGVADAIVAMRRRQPPESIAVRAARGRKLLRDRRHASIG